MSDRWTGWLALVATFLAGVLVGRAGLIEDILSYWEDIVYLTQEHIFLVVVAGGLAILVGVPLGVWLSRPHMRRFAETAMQALNIGTTPAIFGLFVATLLPIVRNAYAGLLAVPRHLIEAADGMGMTPVQILLRVEVPNALFVMFAGIRTALAICVGTAPLAFLIGGGGLGELIFTGIDLFEPGMMLAGAVPTALLAVLTDFVIGQAQFWLVPRGVNPLR